MLQYVLIVRQSKGTLVSHIAHIVTSLYIYNIYIYIYIYIYIMACCRRSYRTHEFANYRCAMRYEFDESMACCRRSYRTHESYRTHTNTTCHTKKCLSSPLIEPCQTYEWVKAHIWIRHITHIRMSHVKFVKKPRHTNERLSPHMYAVAMTSRLLKIVGLFCRI